ncbi:MAG TPA: right-handed parallel beta-helix repeat-containing protein [Pirellulales bacterium]|nr:right-handed parallel beta-helix repeat-containing protein [Pirellulales bacterium]
MRLRGFALVFFIASQLRAADVFVDNVAGDDLRDGGQAESTGASGPVRTLKRALELAQAGDRLRLANRGVPYREPISLSTARHCGNALSPFIIDGQGATLDGSTRVGRGAWEPYRGAVFRFRPAKKSFQHLFLDGKPAARRMPAAGDRALPALEPLEWCRHDGVLYFRVEQDKLPWDYPLSCHGLQTGITLYHVHDVVIANLVVQGFQLDGVNAHDGTRHCELIGVTSRGNGRSGVAVCGSSKLRLDDCLIGDNGEAQLRAEGLADVTVDDSDLVGNTGPAVVHVGQSQVQVRQAKTSDEPADGEQADGEQADGEQADGEPAER